MSRTHRSRNPRTPTGFTKGDLVVAPFVWSDGTCDFCRQGLQTSCRHGGQWGHDLDGGQGEAVRVPQAQGTLVMLPVAEDSALLPSSGATSEPPRWLRGAETRR